ncbi:MAG: hypothetical protein KBD01_15880 [Acidobacteria bacterium]|nr:hypothetical protein [Acidobacteriota bacterium]
MSIARFVALVVAIVGAVLVLTTLVALVVPAAARSLPPLPFFNRVWPLSRLPVALAVASLGLLLVAAAWAVFSRRRLALPLFLVAGWGGLAFALLAAWPGSRVRDALNFALEVRKNQHALPKTATVWDLLRMEVPPGALAVAVAGLVFWIAVLGVGTVHLVRKRQAYTR